MMINFQAEACEGSKSLLELTAIAGGKIFEAKAHAILNIGKIYVNKNGGFFPHSTILDEVILDSNRIVFPQYTEKDIHVKQWENGTHWYAYVGDFAVEMHGENKWNSEERAKTMAEAYLYRLKNEQFKIKE